MYHINGFNLSFNTTKVLYTAEELGVNYHYNALDPAKGEHKSDENMARHPLGKTPSLDHGGKYLFESSAICRYLASSEKSKMYPDDPYQRGVVDQWMDYHTAHAGRWIGTLLFERVFRSAFGMGEKNEENEKEALGFLKDQLEVVNAQLGNHQYIAGESATIADSYCYAYYETTAKSEYSLSPYPNIERWAKDYSERPSVGQVHEKIAS